MFCKTNLSSCGQMRLNEKKNPNTVPLLKVLLQRSAVSTEWDGIRIGICHRVRPGLALVKQTKSPVNLSLCIH